MGLLAERVDRRLAPRPGDRAGEITSLLTLGREVLQRAEQLLAVRIARSTDPLLLKAAEQLALTELDRLALAPFLKQRRKGERVD